MKKQPTVMISSTARDLPEYRDQAMDACLRASMLPEMMEHLPAMDADAIEASLSALVDKADVYVGLFAHRYGYIPEGHDISITEMEYERALQRGIPRLIFLMDDDVPVLPKDVDKGESALKLDALKKRLKKERVANFFKNPDDLRGQVLHSLGEVKKKFEAAKSEKGASAKVQSLNFHHVSPIPKKSEPYIAHPYTLLQVKGLIGRKSELEMLTDWITRPEYEDITIFNIVAIGGMGKSALTWTWFNEIAPQEAKFAGRVWWNFYESDASFENFLSRTLAYVSGASLEALKDIPQPDQQNALLLALNQEPFLLVLDGLERILIAYARQDAAFLADNDAFDDETANWVAGAYDLPQSAGQSFVGKHFLRKTANVQAGQFLRKLARINKTRVLVSTRLYPADLQVPTGQAFPGCFPMFLEGLSDQDALDLWRAYGAKGSRETMLPIFNTFDKHPLLIQVLAYEVAEFREAPGDFDAWQAANPDCNLFDLPLVQVQSEVLAHALRGLTSVELHTLRMIAGFRMPAGMETVKALLIRDKQDGDSAKQPFNSLKELDLALTSLEDRGLLGWDRRANRYDLHPIVRGVVWSGLEDARRKDIYDSLHNHFEALPMIENWQKVESLEDLTPAVGLYNTLISLGSFDEALIIFKERLEDATLYRLNASLLRVELLRDLFPDGLDTLPRLTTTQDQSFILNSLALGYHFSGKPCPAIPLFEFSDKIYECENDYEEYSSALYNMSNSLRFIGKIYRSENTARKAFAIDRGHKDRFSEGLSLSLIGLAFALRGNHEQAEIALHCSLQILTDQNHQQSEGLINAYLAQQALEKEDTAAARPLADRAWELAAVCRYEIDFIRAARLQGSAALHLGDLNTADERLHHALTRARRVQLVDQELPALIALAQLHSRQNEPEKAREMLEDVWESAERGPYPMFHSDALNVLAQIEQEAGNKDAAIKAATDAYCKAWCDGPPYAYHYGLTNARKLLATLDAPEPTLPAFDQSKYEPMPEVDF
jgi:tetratricopeptide (TPR) repeat protein